MSENGAHMTKREFWALDLGEPLPAAVRFCIVVEQPREYAVVQNEDGVLFSFEVGSGERLTLYFTPATFRQTTAMFAKVAQTLKAAEWGYADPRFVAFSTQEFKVESSTKNDDVILRFRTPNSELSTALSQEAARKLRDFLSAHLLG